MISRIVKLLVASALLLGSSLPTNAQPTVEYLHTDALGTPVAVTNSAGTVIERSVYEPYGQLVNRPLVDGPGFTGHVQDAATGLTYMQQRYYDPQLGVFLYVDPVSASSDPVGLFHRYRYANNNPYKFVDPDGRLICDRKQGGGCNRVGSPSGNCQFCLGGNGSATASGGGKLMPLRKPGGAPIPGPEVGKALADGVQAIAKAIEAREREKVHVTYTLTKPGYPKDSVYSGRASGYGDPDAIVAARFARHHMRLFGYGNPQRDEVGIGPDGRLAIRGREQQLIDYHGGVGSDFVGNRIRAVSATNEQGRLYHEAANIQFGNIAPYTGLLP
jgi:RHS repeat-associated protein